MIAAHPDRLVSFGDSLSDSGAAFDISGAVLEGGLAVPVPAQFLAGPAYAGVLSNGPVHTQITATLLGLDPSGSLFGYAVGGARVLGSQPIGDRLAGFEDDVAVPPGDPLLGFDINVGAQLDRYLDGAAPSPTAAAPADPGPDGTVFATFFAGLNDLADLGDRLADGAGPLEVAGALVELTGKTRQIVLDLAQSERVDTIALYTLPGLGFFPPLPGTMAGAAEVADLAIGLYNGAINSVAGEIERTTGVKAEIVRLDDFTAEIDADPATFGFAAKGPFYLDDGVPGPEQIVRDGQGDVVEVVFPVNPDPALEALPLDAIQFFDAVHFSAALHASVGAFGARSLTHRVRFEGDGDDRLVSFVGDDLVFGQDGADALYLGLGDDIAFGGIDDDEIRGAAGQDLLVGGSGADALRGGSGDDLLAGGAGDDDLEGGAGDDTLLDGTGADRVRAGAGDDVMIWVDPGADAPHGGDRFDGGAGEDVLYLVTDRGVETGGRTLFDILLGRWDLSEIGVTAFGVERVELVTPEAYAGTGVEVTVPGLFAEADLWGVV
jgi:phospholipase/lecithinase/hemolysin